MPISSLITLTAIQWGKGSSSTGELFFYIFFFRQVITLTILSSERKKESKLKKQTKKIWAYGATPGNPDARNDNTASCQSSKGAFKTLLKVPEHRKPLK